MFKKMTEFGPDSGGRVKGVTIVKPIVFGNVARYFGKKREEDGHTHQWSVYVKPYRNEDMSAYVKKIQFKLHESYGNPLRVVTKPPYEITETGWGEFEITIKIVFIDPNERSVTLYHLLKLFQSDSSAMPKKTVVSEFYDEMVKGKKNVKTERKKARACVCGCSRRARAEDQGKNGGGQEENQSGDCRAKRQAEGQ
ncbi:YEATS domain-containing protein 4 isoform X3 [Stigmatopora argus]